MTAAFDNRIVNLGIEIDGAIQTFSDLYISAKGVRYASDINNAIEVIIYNLTAAQRNFLLTQTSPFATPRTAKFLTLDVGRVSTGVFRVYQGNIIASNPTQPPDIGISLQGLSNSYGLGNIMPINQPGLSKLSTIAKQVAANTGTTLNFQATDKNISNFSSTSAATKQISDMAQCGGVYAFCDNDTLHVTDQGKPLQGMPRIVNKSTGMVGIPEIDELGVRVKVMIDSTYILGGQITIQSDLNPSANGTYTIAILEFDVATREDAFWYNIYATRYNLISPQYGTLP